MMQVQDPAAMRQVRELERVIEARLEEARNSHARVDAAREQADLLVAEAAADAAAEAVVVSARILHEARAWVETDEAEQQRIGAEITQRAADLREELVAATVTAVLAPTAGQPTDPTPEAGR